MDEKEDQKDDNELSLTGEDSTNAKERPTYITVEPTGDQKSLVSFGDGEGHTAFLTEHGEFAMINIYTKKHKFVSIEPISASPVYRQGSNLIRVCDGAVPGFGLRLRDRTSFHTDSQTTRFVERRWPRISYCHKIEDVEIDVEVQSFITEGVVVQEHVFRNRRQQKASIPITLDLRAGTRINPEGIGRNGFYKLGSLNFKKCNGKFTSIERTLWDVNGELTIVRLEVTPLDEKLTCPIELESLLIETSEGDNDSESCNNVLEDELNFDLCLPESGERTMIMLYDMAETRKEDYAGSSDNDNDENLENPMQTENAKDIPRSSHASAVGTIRKTLREMKSSVHEKIGFVERINIRHIYRILDVFSVPISGGHGRNHVIAPTDGDGLVSIDMGYRNIEYLLTMYERLENLTKYDTKLKKRIFDVCIGYLNWCFDLAPNFEGWDWNVDGSVESDSRVDFPQVARRYWCLLINLFDFHGVFRGEDNFIMHKLSNRLKDWYPDLYRENEVPEFPKYQFLDNVLMWWVVKSLDKFISHALERENLQHQSQILKQLKENRDYTLLCPDRYCERILKTFKAERVGDLGQDYTLYRSASTDRFAFKSQLEFPLHPIFQDFFCQDSTRNAAWTKILKVQSLEEVAKQENHLLSPVRYALALAMADSGISSAPRGRMLVRFDPITLCSDEILWYYTQSSLIAIHYLGYAKFHEDTKDHFKTTLEVSWESDASKQARPFTSARPSEPNTRMAQEEVPNGKGKLTGRKTMLTSSIDLKNFVENYRPYQIFGLPNFPLKTPENIEDEDFEQELWDNPVFNQRDSRPDQVEMNRFNEAFVVDIGQKKSRTSSQTDCLLTSNFELLKRRITRQREISTSKKQLWQVPRFVEGCTQSVAVTLCKASYRNVGEEWLSMSGFLRRHSDCPNFMKNHLHKNANIWVTEFHIGYITLVKDDQISTPVDIKNGWIGDYQKEKFPQDSSGNIESWQQATVGYRFVGDAHDRYWTCTILSQTHASGWFNAKEFYNTQSQGQTKKAPEFYGQRQVLEVRLFAKMTNQVCKSTKEILDALNKVLENSESSTYEFLTQHDEDKQSHKIEERGPELISIYLQSTKLLARLNHNIENTLLATKDWRDRFNVVDKPRWSKNDESTYRKILDVENKSGQANITRLEQLKSQISRDSERVNSLKQALMSILSLRESKESRRSAIEATKQAEDVKLFTCATVVFLPLSFSSSLFSMAGSPASSTLVTFIVTTAIALSVTILILFNIKTLKLFAHNAANPPFKRIQKIMLSQADRNWNVIAQKLDQVSRAKNIRRTQAGD
ncbi:MAG: hypothetical protein M1834_005275 [Cirrosporium novae-zelandiae]|nr:MAG: hypothetical protein M1834_005275 [Cirrosporium novae-zelandiae]